MQNSNPKSYDVKCDACHGRKYIGGQLCQKCRGEGQIQITQADLTISQRAAKEVALIMHAVLLVGCLIGAALSYFGVIK